MTRIAKTIAKSGLVSRRKAEQLIFDGQVIVNETVITSPAYNALESDKIIVNGKPLPPIEQTKIWLWYKPKKVLITHNDTKNRPFFLQLLPPELPKHVIAVGRLDFMSEGLMILTNDGDLARLLELPKSKITRKYTIKILGSLSDQDISKINAGITIDGINYQSICKILQKSKNYSLLEMELQEGKNREIRNIMQYFGVTILRLIRTEYGSFNLEILQSQTIKEIDSTMIKNLKKQLDCNK